MRKTQNTIIVLLFALSFAVLGEERYRTRWGTEIVFSHIGRDYYQQRAFLESADGACSRLFRTSDKRISSPDTLRCRIVVMDDSMRRQLKEPFKVLVLNTTVTIYVDSDFAAWQRHEEYYRQFISALVMTKCSVNPEGRLDSLPCWLIAGIDAEIRHRHRPVKVTDYQPGLRAVALDAHIPDVKSIIDSKLSLSDGVNVYEYYSNCCRFLLLECYQTSSLTDNALADMVILSASKNYSPEEVFSSSVVRTILKKNKRLFARHNLANAADGAKLQYWFGRTLRQQYINTFAPLDWALTAREFARINDCTYEVKTGHDTWRKQKLPLAKLPDKWGQIKDPIAKTQELRNMISRLRSRAPVLCMEGLVKLEKAVTALNLKDYFDSRKAHRLMAGALTDFKKAMQRQRQLEQYLFKCEGDFVDAQLVFSRELQIVNGGHPLWKNLDELLRSVEADFLEK